MRFTFDKASRFARLTAEPGDTLAEWESAALALLADERFLPGMGILSDQRACEHFDIEDVRAQARFVQRHRDRLAGRRIASVRRAGAQFGMGRVAKILAERGGVRMMLFTDPREALTWVVKGDSLPL